MTDEDKIAGYIARSMRDDPESWATRKNPLGLSVAHTELGIGVLELGASIGRSVMFFRIAVTSDEEGNGERTFDIVAERHPEARKIICAALTPWRQKAEEAAKARAMERLARSLDGPASAKEIALKRLES